MTMSEASIEKSKLNARNLAFLKVVGIASTVVILLLVMFYGYVEYVESEKLRKRTQSLVLKPRINDLYFMDFRLVSENLRPNQIYRVAKVADITGDIITLVYGTLYYQTKRELQDSIRFGQLGFYDYYDVVRYNLTHSEIRILLANGAIYEAVRPIKNMLNGHVVSAEDPDKTSKLFIQGTKENNNGEELLNSAHTKTKLKTAFELFEKAAASNYAPAKVNLAQMYLVGLHVNKDVDQALRWFKEASFQSFKPAILKYGLVCKQLVWCDVQDFYDELAAHGVNIEVAIKDERDEKLR